MHNLVPFCPSTRTGLVLLSTVFVLLLSGCDSGNDSSEVVDPDRGCPELAEEDDLFRLPTDVEFNYVLRADFRGVDTDTVAIRYTRTENIQFDGRSIPAFIQQVKYRHRADPVARAIFARPCEGLIDSGTLSVIDTLYHVVLTYPDLALGATEGKRVRAGVDFQTLQVEIIDTLAVTRLPGTECIDTPAGNFCATVYKHTRPPPFDVRLGTDIYEYFVPGIGLVARLFKGEGSSIISDSVRLLSIDEIGNQEPL